MRIKSFQKTTLIDYPGFLASTIFVGACNFKCDYCYNKELVYNHHKLADLDELKLLSDLKLRSNFIEGIVITGGEPTLQVDLVDFILKLREITKKMMTW